jgi:hypothetical protein
MAAPTGLSKYLMDDPDERALHRGNVIGKRPMDGLPVRGDGGARRDMVGDQADEVPIVCDYRAQMFRMWLPEEAKLYVQVCDHVANGAFKIIARREILAEGAETGLPGQEMKIWLEWAQLYGQAEDPRERMGGGR